MDITRILQIGYLPVHMSCIGDGAQFVYGRWYMPRWGRDTLQRLAEFEKETTTEFETTGKDE